MSCVFLRLLAAALTLGTAAALRAEFSAATLERLDRPFQGESITLSPDGRHVAYSIAEPGKLTLRIANLESNQAVDLPVVTASGSSSIPPRLLLLRWATAQRLVLEESDGDVIAVNADGSQPLKLWNGQDDGLQGKMSLMLRSRGRAARIFHDGKPPRIQAAVPDDPNHIVLESVALLGVAVQSEVSNLYRIDIHTGDLELLNDDSVGMGLALYGRGRMLYDQQGRARLLRNTWPNRENEQQLYYFGAKESRPSRGVIPTTLDEFLGRSKPAEFNFTGPNYLGEHSFPLAFDRDPNVLFYASNVGRDTYGIFSLNLATKARSEVLTSAVVDLTGFEPDDSKPTLVFDAALRRLVGVRFANLRQQTAWLDPQLTKIQAGLEATFPRETVELLEWDHARTRLLARVSSERDPGRYLIVDPRTGAIDTLLHRAPWLTAEDKQTATEFTFTTAAGVRLTGYLTLPTTPRSDPPPLVIYCQGGLWDRAEPGFNRETQLLANLGFVTLRLNYRGTAGFGRKPLTALQEGVESIPLADMQAALDWLAARYTFDRRRVAVMGEGFGGYLALRAVQLQPENFHAAIAVNAPTNLDAWAAAHQSALAPSGGRGGTRSTFSVLDFHSLIRENFIKKAQRTKTAAQPAKGERAILVIEGDSENLTPWSTVLGRAGVGLQGTRVERLGISGNLENGASETRAKVFQKIDEFLKAELYEGKVSVGELKVLPDTPKEPTPKR